MVKTISYQIFKQGSKTFFTASLFFPKEQKLAVFDLYAFVRVFDDFVDQVPPLIEDYQKLKSSYYEELNEGIKSGSEVVSNFVALQKKYSFDQSWIDAFFVSMEMDFHGKVYSNMEETENYIYGSAEVIGLMMAKIMNLDPSSYEYAKLLGKAFQYMNMIRDVKEDIHLGRIYLPELEQKKFGIDELSPLEAQKKPSEFGKFIRAQIDYYKLWRDGAKKGFKLIPYRYRIPINIAVDLFDDTINKIQADPLRIFTEKIKPTKFKRFFTVIKRLIIS